MEARLGVLAFGDSITNGGGELQWGVALQSWALWTARGLGLPYTGCAVDGATAAHVVRRADPALPRARPRCRTPATTSAASTSGSTTCAGRAGIRPPTSATSRAALGVPARALRPGARVHDPARPRPAARGRARCDEANAAIEPRRGAGALVLDLRDFGARNRVMVDAVHPTAFGQIAIAERALDVLAADGMTVRVRPHTLIAYETTRWRRLRGDATYVYRQLKQALRIAPAPLSRSRRSRRAEAARRLACGGSLPRRAVRRRASLGGRGEQRRGLRCGWDACGLVERGKADSWVASGRMPDARAVGVAGVGLRPGRGRPGTQRRRRRRAETMH